MLISKWFKASKVVSNVLNLGSRVIFLGNICLVQKIFVNFAAVIKNKKNKEITGEYRTLLQRDLPRLSTYCG